VLLPDCDADPVAGAEGAGDEGDAGEVAGRVAVVAIGGATGVGTGVVVRGGVGTVTGGLGAGGSAVVTGSGGGGGAGGSAVVAVVIGSGGGGGTAVVIGTDGVVTVTPGTGGSSRASACAAMRPARAAAKPRRLPKRENIPKLQRATPANGCG
jgi:hypothetical protein